jgi:hypothetical protein
MPIFHFPLSMRERQAEGRVRGKASSVEILLTFPSRGRLVVVRKVYHICIVFSRQSGYRGVNIDAFAKSRETISFVIPAKAGMTTFCESINI